MVHYGQLFPFVFFFFVDELGVKSFNAGGAEAVTEHCVGMLTYIGFQLVPIAFVVAYLFATGAYRHQAAQHFHFRQTFR